LEPELDLIKEDKTAGIEMARGLGSRPHQEDRMGYFYLDVPDDLKKKFTDDLMIKACVDIFEVLDIHCRKNYLDGAVLSLALVIEGRIYVAGVGDTHATLLTQEGETRSLSSSHNTRHPNEVKRMEKAGTEVRGLYFMKKQTGEGLQPSRVIGDRSKRGVSGVSPWISMPDIAMIDLPPKGKVIICSDGIYPTVGEIDFGIIQRNLAQGESYSQKICAIVQSCYKKSKKTLDNHSVLVADCDTLRKQTDVTVMFVADGHGGTNTVNHIAASLPEICAQVFTQKLTAKFSLA
jgi:serine/threonine protein phosphatase PrpC